MDLNKEYVSNGLIVSIDWLSFTIKYVDTVSEVIDMLGFDEVLFREMPKGSNGYKRHKKMLGHNISVLYDGNDGMGIHVDVSGSDIYTLLSSFRETLVVDTPFGVAYDMWQETTLQCLLRTITGLGQITRLDLAIDDLGGNYYSLQEVLALLKNGNYVSRFRRNRSLEERENTDVIGQTIYFGSPQSEIMLRIYDKKMEQNKNLSPDSENYIDYEWIRWELQLRNDRAMECARILLNGVPLGSVSIGILSYYVRFIKNDDSNKSRCSMEDKWKQFLSDVEQLRICASPRARTIDDKKRWLKEQVAPSLAIVLMKEQGDMTFIYDLIRNGEFRISERDKSLLQTDHPDVYAQYFVD